MYEDYEHKEVGRRAVAREFCDWIEAVMIAVIFAVLVFAFVVRLAGVDGASMRPTLEHRDRLLISRLGGEFRQGEIVVVIMPDHTSEMLVKRVIAIGGQTVYIDFDAGIVFVDGYALYEPYINETTRLRSDVTFPVTVPDGHVFVLGDNRNNSRDSRDSHIGMVDTRYILGRAFYRLFPYERMGVPR